MISNTMVSFSKSGSFILYQFGNPPKFSFIKELHCTFNQVLIRFDVGKHPKFLLSLIHLHCNNNTNCSQTKCINKNEWGNTGTSALM